MKGIAGDVRATRAPFFPACEALDGGTGADRARGPEGVMEKLRATVILAVFLFVTLILIPWQWLLLKLGHPARRTFPHRYHRFVARLFGIRIQVHRQPAGASHAASGQSFQLAGYRDLFGGGAALPLSPSRKSNSWPFFGTLARLQRTVFVTRARRSETGAARDAIADAAQGGRCAGAVSGRHLE